MASRKADTDQEREPGGVDDRPAKRVRVEDEDALDDDEEDRSAPLVTSQASDLYLDTVRLGHFTTSARVFMNVFADKSREVGL
jgi:hypothetical protein